MMEIGSVTWERIQVVVEVRPSAGVGEPGVDALHLRRADGRRATIVAPFLVEPAEGGSRVHFNIMAGQAQMPLDHGRWVVVTAAPDAAPLTVAPDARLDPTVVSRRFAYEGGRYDVMADVDPDTRILSFQIDRVRVAPPPAVGLVRRFRRLLRPAYRALQGLLVALCIAIARRTVRRTGRRIMFTGANAREAKGNLRIIHDRMVARGLDREYDLIYTHGARRGKQDGARVRFSLPELWRMTREVAAADVILVTGSLHAWAGLISPSPGTRYIQLWHASARSRRSATAASASRVA